MKVDLSLDSMDGSDSESGVPLWSILKLENVIGSFLERNWTESGNYKNIEISVNFLSENQIRDYNRLYREIDEPTDVLSFPIWESSNGKFEPPGDWESLLLGDILICPSVVYCNSSESGLDYLSEMALMLAHGILHLLGMDHDIPERQNLMWALQGPLAKDIASCMETREDPPSGGSSNG